MKKQMLLMFVGALFFCNILKAEDEYPWKLTVCAIFQNEGEWLQEWIEYHLLQGVDHFLLYNDRSDDNYQAVLQKYIDRGIVEVIDWPNYHGSKGWVGCQTRAYQHGLKRLKGHTKWIAYIDIDEFLVPIKHDNMLKLLASYEYCGGVSLEWRVFGTSHLLDVPPNKLMIEALTRCFALGDVHNRQHKSIVRPEKVEFAAIHEPVYKTRYRGAYLGKNIAQINHYWLRTERWYRERKIPRREFFENATRTEKHVKSTLYFSNLSEDLAIQRFVPELRSKIFGETCTSSPQP